MGVAGDVSFVHVLAILEIAHSIVLSNDATKSLLFGFFAVLLQHLLRERVVRFVVKHENFLEFLLLLRD